VIIYLVNIIFLIRFTYINYQSFKNEFTVVLIIYNFNTLAESVAFTFELLKKNTAVHLEQSIAEDIKFFMVRPILEII